MGFLRRSKLPETIASGNILLGLAVPRYYQGYSPVLNWFKAAELYQVFVGATPYYESEAWAAGLLDPDTGEIKPGMGVTSRTDVFFVHPLSAQKAAGANYDGETWIAEWDGTGTGNINNLNPGSPPQDKSVTNKISFAMGIPQTDLVSLTLTVGGNPADPPRNARIYQARYADNVANGEFTNPDWRAVVATFPTLRFMDVQATNNSLIEDFDQLATESYYRWGNQLNTITYTPPSGATNTGPKGGVHPSIICKILNETGCAGHVNIPTAFTDAAVLEFVEYMRDHTTKHVTYEFSNEIFHGAFYQWYYAQNNGIIEFPADDAPGHYVVTVKWYGYRSAQIMKIVRDAYGDTSRWSGALASQAVATFPIETAISGVTAWKSSTGSSLNVSDLFRGLYFAPYYANTTDGIGNTYGRTITAITKENPAKVTSNGHGLSTGDRVKIGIYNGMTELNSASPTITVLNADEFTLDGINSTGYSTFTGGDGTNNYWAPAAIWDLMDASGALYPGTNPSPYTYFNQQLKQACLTGTCDFPGIELAFPLTFYEAIWEDQKAIADSYGLQMRQYEGGNHFVGSGTLQAYGGEPQLNEFLLQWPHSQESADVQGAWCAAWNALGGKETAKFQEGGGMNQNGAWAGIRYWPTVANGGTVDTSNPLWQAITYYNEL